MTALMCKVTDTLGQVGKEKLCWRTCAEYVYTRYRRKEDMSDVKYKSENQFKGL